MLFVRDLAGLHYKKILLLLFKDIAKQWVVLSAYLKLMFTK